MTWPHMRYYVKNGTPDSKVESTVYGGPPVLDTNAAGALYDKVAKHAGFIVYARELEG